MRFFKLSSPESEARLARWDEPMNLEQITCPVNDGHMRGGRRTTDLSIVLPRVVEDFVWTWLSECMIQQRVLDLFRQAGFTGFEVKPVKARFRGKSTRVPPVLWELIVTGWGGMAPPESGIHLLEEKSCKVCGHLRYSGLTNPERLIDERKWDGSDFFIVWPLPNYRFVSERVADFIGKQGLTGVRFLRPETLEVDGASPGRLSHSMPEARARELGEALGIF